MGLMRNVLLVVLGLGAAFLLWGLYLASTPLGKEKSQARYVIERCKDNGGGVICDGLAREFEQEYGARP
jgi:hypothetical protein